MPVGCHMLENLLQISCNRFGLGLLAKPLGVHLLDDGHRGCMISLCRPKHADQAKHTNFHGNMMTADGKVDCEHRTVSPLQHDVALLIAHARHLQGDMSKVLNKLHMHSPC